MKLKKKHFSREYFLRLLVYLVLFFLLFTICFPIEFSFFFFLHMPLSLFFTYSVFLFPFSFFLHFRFSLSLLFCLSFYVVDIFNPCIFWPIYFFFFWSVLFIDCDYLQLLSLSLSRLLFAFHVSPNFHINWIPQNTNQ